MAAPKKKKKSHSGKVILALIVLMAVGLAGYGYFSQSSELRDDAHAAENLEPLPASDALFIPKPDDIVIGNADAPVTILEYASLSCPHCAHFYNEELPTVKKQLLDSGRAKLVYRHFPLNEPALRASQLVECSDGAKRTELLHALFASQKDWAFEESFKDNLKKFAANADIDAAQFDSCLADKEGENAILAVRQEAATRAHVDSTPSFFVNGVLLTEAPVAESFAKAVEAAEKPAK